MYRELKLVQREGKSSLSEMVVEYAKRGWKLYESPFELAGLAVQPMVKDDESPDMVVQVGNYLVLEKTGKLSVPMQAKELKSKGWLFYGGPFQLNGLGAQAMTIGNMPRYVALTSGASQAYNALEEELNEIKAKSAEQDVKIAALEAQGGGGGSGGSETGYFNYHNALGMQMLDGGQWATLKNDGKGIYTQILYGPAGVASVLDPLTGNIKLSGLNVGDYVHMQHTISVTPYLNGMDFNFRNYIGQAGQQYETPIGAAVSTKSGAGTPSGDFTVSSAIFVRDENTKLGGLFPQIKSNGTAEVHYKGVLITITRKPS